MILLFVSVVFISILVGMAISVGAFGTGGKRAKIFEDIYFSIEEVDGIGVVYTKKGDYSAVLKMENPVRKYSADTDSYYEFTSLMASVMQVLGDGYAIHKQDIFVRKQLASRARTRMPRSVSSQMPTSAFSTEEATQRQPPISPLPRRARAAA